MVISQSFVTAIIYALGAFLSMVVLLASYKPEQWRVKLMPENTVEPGDDIIVPVGIDCSRVMRVMSKNGDNEANAIDLRDQQHHNSTAIAISVAWPVLVPICLMIVFMQSMVNKQHAAASMQAKPRPREDVPNCMREVTGRWTD